MQEFIFVFIDIAFLKYQGSFVLEEMLMTREKLHKVPEPLIIQDCI